MDKRVLIICRGIQGSGKSTWAKQWCHEDPEHRVRFNNDDIRNMLGAIGGHSDWGDINPATKKVEGDYGEKYKGSVSEKESMITPENGFVLIETLEPGVSPLSVIEERDKRYEQMAKK